MKTLWLLFIAGQILGAGNLNYHMEAGYYEMNPMYGRHPSKQKVYTIKAAECIVLYGLTKALPKYEKHLLVGSNIIIWGVIYHDHRIKGATLGFRW